MLHASVRAHAGGGLDFVIMEMIRERKREEGERRGEGEGKKGEKEEEKGAKERFMST